MTAKFYRIGHNSKYNQNLTVWLYRTNVWNYRGISSSTKASREELALHPTVKPVAMVADAMRDCCQRGGLVLDAFCGSGTVLIAAQKTGRRARTIEIDPHYCDTSIIRWQSFAKDDAILLATGETFEQVYVRRGFEEINVDNNATQSNRSQNNRTQSNGAMTKPVVCEQQNCRTIVPSQSNNANGVLAHGNISGDDRVNSNSIGSVDKVEDGNSDTDRR